MTLPAHAEPAPPTRPFAAPSTDFAPWAKCKPETSPLRAHAESARALVARMSLEEKASLCSGHDFWTTKAIERLGVEAICLTDGPHGVRKAASTDFTQSLPATCFPTASALGSSWNQELLGRIGAALGRESQAQGVQILLGPGVNMKRSPLCGRNFEYFSEDPLLAGKLAAAHVRGVQGQGVGASVKHFAANNQEHERTTNNSNLDERTLNEIYLPAFEIAVREAQPWTVMCAYNRVGGVFASENAFLLDDVLMASWGLEGLVVSDWGAVCDRVLAITAGLHLEMPGSQGRNDALIVQAVKAGRLPQERLDAIVTRILTVTLCALAERQSAATFDVSAHHALAQEAAAESLVLLKNDALLPLDAHKPLKVALIGQFAAEPRYQGAGSSQVRPTRLSTLQTALSTRTRGAWQLSHAAGYDAEGNSSAEQLQAASQLAAKSDVAIVVVGLPDSYESEGFDRKHLSLPAGHDHLVDRVAAVQQKTVVVLMNGAAVAMPWAQQVPAIVEAWLGGQAGGDALADALLGIINPSGKLSETFPRRLEDTPAYLDFPGQSGETRYGEGIFMGYRWYEARGIAPLFPFGHGLSYTRFDYSALEVSAATSEPRDRGVLFTASACVRNAGQRAGQEVVQLYVGEVEPRLRRPPKELRHFDKIALAPGEERVVRFELCARDFAHYDPRVHAWVVDTGRFQIFVGGSSAGPLLTASIEVECARPFPPLSRESMLKDVADYPRGSRPALQLRDKLVGMLTGNADRATETPEQRKARQMAEAFWSELPLWKIPLMSQGLIRDEELDQLLATATGTP